MLSLYVKACMRILHAREASPPPHTFGAFLISMLLMRTPRLTGN